MRRRATHVLHHEERRVDRCGQQARRDGLLGTTQRLGARPTPTANCRKPSARGSLTTTEEVSVGAARSGSRTTWSRFSQPFGLPERDRSTPHGFERAPHRNQEIRPGRHAAERTDGACGR